MSNRHFIIIGAGLGGLAAGLALLRAGYAVRIFEQSPILGEVGAGIMITPNSSKVLMHLGLGPAIRARAVEPEASVYRRYDSGEEILRKPLRGYMETRYGAPYLHIHRADLHKSLVEAVRKIAPDAIVLGHQLSRTSSSRTEVVAHFQNGDSARGDALIGADGIRSTVRRLLFGDNPPRFTGQVAWRGLVPAAALPATVTGPVSTAWIGPQRHIIQYSLREGSIVNYVAIVASEAWADDSWNRRSKIDEVVAEFEGWSPEVLAMLRATDPNQSFKWGLFDRDPVSTWTQGFSTLLGDAAHPTLPFMAQGSAMAIEDALVFARSQSAAATVEEGLARYEAARKERTGWIVLQSRAASLLYQTTEGNKDEERARNLDRLYTYDATEVAV